MRTSTGKAARDVSPFTSPIWMVYWTALPAAWIGSWPSRPLSLKLMLLTGPPPAIATSDIRRVSMTCGGEGMRDIGLPSCA